MPEVADPEGRDFLGGAINAAALGVAGGGQVQSAASLGTIQQIADQLTSGFWNGDTHHFPVTQGGSLTVNISTLNAGEQSIALSALGAWGAVIGITFHEVTSGAQITFDDSGTGLVAETSAVWSNGITTSAQVHITSDWITQYGTGVGGYSFQTYLHEIGHALGLGHPGNYNQDATYSANAIFANDAWSTSVMSYFDQTENTYFANQGFTENFVTTPMMADILAIQHLYGLSTNYALADNTYALSDGGPAQCIYDAGGNDWIYAIWYSGSQLINLNPGTFSNIGGEVGNLSIALGVVIENALGGPGPDTLIGNDANNLLQGGEGDDTLTGGAGDDRLVGESGTNILDGGAGSDTADFYTYDSSAGVSVNLALGTAVKADGSIHDTLISIENVSGTQSDDTIVGDGNANHLEGGAGHDTLIGAGGDDILSGNYDTDTLTGGSGNDTFLDTRSNFNGDTITDFGPGDKIVFSDAILSNFSFSLSGKLLTYTGGSLTLSNPPNGVITASAAPGGGVQLTASITHAVHNDFNGDGRSDVLWHDDTGRVTDWLGNANSGLSGNFANADLNSGTDWHIAGTGDFNGDGKSDILWRNDNGDLTDWLGQSDGNFSSNFGNAYYQLNNSWHVAGTGDFNGDGREDILWRNDSGRITDWLGQTGSGGFVSNFANADANAGLDWHIAGTGDFNGDGVSDILWRNDNGDVTDWFGQGGGGFASNFGNAYYEVDSSWHIAGTGDFNGDGITDILWRNDNGRVTDWLGQSNRTGGFTSNFANADLNAGTDWHIAEVGDFNGDGRSDILWRNDNGDVTNWLGQANGNFTSNFGNAYYQVENSWHVQDPMIHLV